MDQERTLRGAVRSCELSDSFSERLCETLPIEEIGVGGSVRRPISAILGRSTWLDVGLKCESIEKSCGS
jgi:hypothetical protein